MEIGTGRSVSVSVSVLTMAVCESNFRRFRVCKASLALRISSEKRFLDVRQLFLWHEYACGRLNVRPQAQAWNQEGSGSIAIPVWTSESKAVCYGGVNTGLFIC